MAVTVKMLPDGPLQVKGEVEVMDPQGNIYLSASQERGVFHHSSFLSGQPVSTAGEIIVENGRVVMVNNVSGHYRPSEESLDLFLDQLAAAGMDVSGITRGLR